MCFLTWNVGVKDRPLSRTAKARVGASRVRSGSPMFFPPKKSPFGMLHYTVLLPRSLHSFFTHSSSLKFTRDALCPTDSDSETQWDGFVVEFALPLRL